MRHTVMQVTAAHVCLARAFRPAIGLSRTSATGVTDVFKVDLPLRVHPALTWTYGLGYGFAAVSQGPNTLLVRGLRRDACRIPPPPPIKQRVNEESLARFACVRSNHPSW
jgi:hypothetical protein